jgi:hypothetical protein
MAGIGVENMIGDVVLIIMIEICCFLIVRSIQIYYKLKHNNVDYNKIMKEKENNYKLKKLLWEFDDFCIKNGSWISYWMQLLFDEDCYYKNMFDWTILRNF